MNNHRLRALLVRLQDRLSEDDRKRLHFFFGNDVPRRIRDDPTLSGTLSLMESLFDQDKINEEDFTFLINAFDEIQCLDAVKFLREHMKQIRSNGMNESVQSLSILMPSLVDHLLKDQEEEEEDKFAAQIPSINQETSSKNTNIIIRSLNNTTDSKIKTDENQKNIFSLRKQLFHRSSIRRQCFILFILLLIIQVGLVIVGCLWIIQLKIQNTSIVNEHIKDNNITYLQLKNRLLKDNDTLHHLKNLLSIDDEKLKELNKLVADNKEKIIKLSEKVNVRKDEQEFTEGKTCGCAKWCFDNRGSQYGVCLDGHACFCNQNPIKNDTIDGNCNCGAWCQKRNYTDGICGDGYTCICSN